MQNGATQTGNGSLQNAEEKSIALKVCEERLVKAIKQKPDLASDQQALEKILHDLFENSVNFANVTSSVTSWVSALFQHEKFEKLTYKAKAFLVLSYKSMMVFFVSFQDCEKWYWSTPLSQDELSRIRQLKKTPELSATRLLEDLEGFLNSEVKSSNNTPPQTPRKENRTIVEVIKAALSPTPKAKDKTSSGFSDRKAPEKEVKQLFCEILESISLEATKSQSNEITWLEYQSFLGSCFSSENLENLRSVQLAKIFSPEPNAHANESKSFAEEDKQKASIADLLCANLFPYPIEENYSARLKQGIHEINEAFANQMLSSGILNDASLHLINALAPLEKEVLKDYQEDNCIRKLAVVLIIFKARGEEGRKLFTVELRKFMTQKIQKFIATNKETETKSEPSKLLLGESKESLPQLVLSDPGVVANDSPGGRKAGGSSPHSSSKLSSRASPLPNEYPNTGEIYQLLTSGSAALKISKEKLIQLIKQDLDLILEQQNLAEILQDLFAKPTNFYHATAWINALFQHPKFDQVTDKARAFLVFHSKIIMGYEWYWRTQLQTPNTEIESQAQETKRTQASTSDSKKAGVNKPKQKSPEEEICLIFYRILYVVANDCSSNERTWQQFQDFTNKFIPPAEVKAIKQFLLSALGAEGGKFYIPNEQERNRVKGLLGNNLFPITVEEKFSPIVKEALRKINKEFTKQMVINGALNYAASHLMKALAEHLTPNERLVIERYNKEDSSVRKLALILIMMKRGGEAGVNLFSQELHKLVIQQILEFIKIANQEREAKNSPGKSLADGRNVRRLILHNSGAPAKRNSDERTVSSPGVVSGQRRVSWWPPISADSGQQLPQSVVPNVSEQPKISNQLY